LAFEKASSLLFELETQDDPYEYNMKIMAVDTATQSCSVAIIDGWELLAETTTLNKETHSRHLLNIIDEVVSKAGMILNRIDGFSVCIGPGSFTGLRIGISSIKGLAYALGKPVVGVSSLESLAFQCRQMSRMICPMIDARKQEVYFCLYRWKNGKYMKESDEQVASPTEAVRSIPSSCLFVGSGAELYRDLILNEVGVSAAIADAQQHIIRASSVARLSLPRFKQQDTDEVHLLAPHYIRKSDAELKLGAVNVLKS
jgi:tRNA threonylcarbamoyladenosine biosynthesis protein TsaB